MFPSMCAYSDENRPVSRPNKHTSSFFPDIRQPARMGEKETHRSLNLLIAKAQRDRVLHGFFLGYGHQGGRTSSQAGEQLSGPHRGLYAGKEYWDRLDPHERLRHILRSPSQWHERWAFCGASAAVMHGLVLLVPAVASDSCRGWQKQPSEESEVCEVPCVG